MNMSDRRKEEEKKRKKRNERRRGKKLLGERILGFLLVAILVLSNGAVALGDSGPMEKEGYEEGVNTGTEQTKEPESTVSEDTSSNEPSQNGTVPEEPAPEGTTIEEETLNLARASETPESYMVTLRLNGGEASNMDGWTAADASSDVYAKNVSNGESLTLPSPSRTGYEFVGWQKTGSDQIETGTTLVVTESCELTAVWKEKLYMVEFHGFSENTTSPDAQELWSAKVPYGSVLWTMDRTPWEEETVVWTRVEEDIPSDLAGKVISMDTAQVTIHLGAADSPEESHQVTVTRYMQDPTAAGQGSEAAYYYTFTLKDTPYFTYGGPSPVKAQEHFATWEKRNGTGFAVLDEKTVFDAKYTTLKNYIFDVFYYYENGVKAKDQVAVIKTEQDVMNHTITAVIEAPEILYYEPEIDQSQVPEGMTIRETSRDANGKTWEIQADVNRVFPSGGDVNARVALIVLYRPADMEYQVVYHVQKVGEGTDPQTDYTKAGQLTYHAKIGDIVSAPDKPAELNVDFSGFEADLDTQQIIHHGKVLEESLVDATTRKATIHMYYNRTYYYVHTLADTTESATYEPERVQYGAKLPADKDGSKLKKTGYEFSKWLWYRVGSDGNLQLLEEEGKKPEKMPSNNLYAIALWKKANTSMQVVYWIEDANSGSFQNVYQKTVEGVPTQDKLVMYLEDGNVDLRLEEEPKTSFPVFTETFEEAIKNKYGKASYKQYFSFDPETTYRQESTSGHATGHVSGRELHYEVKANGSTTINVYYKRNLYTLQFVIQRKMGAQWHVAKETNGTLTSNTWHGLGTGNTVFKDFESSKVQKMKEVTETFGDARITQEYRLTDAVNRNDTRAAVGRYGTITMSGSLCSVYYLTARFEAEIAELWPTLENIKLGAFHYDQPYQYISMGTNKESAYFQTPGRSNKNILSRYSTMDTEIVNNQRGIAVSDNGGKADVTHQMYSYWANSNIKTYQYHFLYEVLDTSLDPNQYEAFDVYNPGMERKIVRWRAKNTDPWKLYVYQPAWEPQNSKNTINKQNQPAKYGYESAGSAFINNTTARDVYFFYNRKEYNLSIYNVNGNWVPQSGFLTIPLVDSYVDEERGIKGDGKKSLAQLGWVSVNPNTETIKLKYEAYLGAIGQEAVVDQLQNLQNQDPLKYPYDSLGDNKYYFHGWYKDQENIAPVDWSINAMQYMIQEQVLYAGWTVPKYRTIYALNGGTWTDRIQMTMMVREVDGQKVILYYPHMTTDPNAEMYWYMPEKPNDYLYMGYFYITSIGQILEANEGGDGHYHLKDGMTIDQMKELSRGKDPGISSGGSAYVCVMEVDGYDANTDTSHRKYINRHSLSGTELPEPKAPVRNGYDFLGWYAFDTDGIDTGRAYTQKVWLKDVLKAGEGIHSYHKEYVYVSESGEAHLLYEDETTKELYYYADQKGYQYSFQYGASLVGEDRTLYAAWKGKQVNESKVLHLVRTADVNPDHVQVDWKSVQINGVSYYQIQPEEYETGIESGAIKEYHAQTPQIEGDPRIWLPVRSQIKVQFGNEIPEGTSKWDEEFDHQGEEPVFKIRIPNVDTDAYTYYTYFVYTPVESTSYTVYQIDLVKAVANGLLTSYSDRFDRATPPTDQEVILDKQTYPIRDMSGTVEVTAPGRSDGLVIYERWKESLRLESEPTNNNIYFYYISHGETNKTTYEVTYHFMKDGNYQGTNKVTITGIPGQKGQVINVRELAEGYTKMLEKAELMRSYAVATENVEQNQAQQSLYQWYQNMKVDVSVNVGGTPLSGTYYVDQGKQGMESLDAVKSIVQDYAVEKWSPTGDAANPDQIVLTETTKIHVDLRDASVTLEKKDSEGKPLTGAVFRLDRFRRVPVDETISQDDETTVYQGVQYVKDTSFQSREAEITSSDGKHTFYNLSANEDAKYIYRVTETKAPQDHTRLAKPVFIQVPYQMDEDGETKTYYEVTYTITNPGIPDLPKTGGFGVYFPLLAGGGAFTLAVLGAEVIYGKTRKRKKGNVDEKTNF